MTGFLFEYEFEGETHFNSSFCKILIVFLFFYIRLKCSELLFTPPCVQILHVTLKIRDPYANTAPSARANRVKRQNQPKRGKGGGAWKGDIQRWAGRRRQRSDVVKLTHSSTDGQKME